MLERHRSQVGIRNQIPATVRLRAEIPEERPVAGFGANAFAAGAARHVSMKASTVSRGLGGVKMAGCAPLFLHALQFMW